MDEKNGEGFVVKTEVEVVENGTGHWNGEMKIIHGRSVGERTEMTSPFLMPREESDEAS